MKVRTTTVIGLPNTIFDLSRPGEFIASYQFHLRLQKASRKMTLIKSTRRLLNAYCSLSAEYCGLQSQRGKSVLYWFRFRARAQAILERIKRMELDLISWVSKTLCYYAGMREDKVFVGSTV